MSHTCLSVNVNKIATLRNTRALDLPSVRHLSQVALEAGAQGITIHPRPDQRHIRREDVPVLKSLCDSFPGAEFNIEGNPFFDYLPHIRSALPTQCTLVPDSPEAFTSNHGWKLTDEICIRLKPMIAEMKSLRCRVSLFMDADSTDIEKARDLGADRIELYTEPYATAFARGGDMLARSIALFRQAAHRAHAIGLGVNAGHDLNLHNLPAFLEGIPGIAEVSIGHALIADALELGMSATVGRYVQICQANS